MELPNILYYVQEFEQLGRNGDAYPESLAEAPRAVLQALGQRYLDETRPLRRGRARFIDKLPNNFMNIGLIHAMLPHATIIDVRRHPMDSGLSCFKQNFATGQSFTYDLEGLGRYYRQYLGLMDHWDRVLPGKVLHVSYEELVRSPEPNAIARYERNIGVHTAFAQMDIAHKGSMFNALQIDRRVLQPQYSLINLRIGLGDTRDTWRAEGYVTNVANKRAVIYQDTTGYNSYPGFNSPALVTPPRVVGVRLSYQWKPTQ